MSDKSRNMNDINDQKTIDRTDQAALDQTAEQQAFSEEIRRRLAAPDSGKPTLEEFKVMVYKDREKRRKKRNTLVACIVVAFIVGYLTYDDLVPEVGADKNPKETIQTEDGVIIEDGGYGSSEEKDNIWVINEWDYIEDAKTVVPEILIPKYIPEDYLFETLMIEIIPTSATVCKYKFNNNGNIILIEMVLQDNAIDSFDINDVSRTLTVEKGKIYIQEMDNKIATIQIDDGTLLYIEGKLSDKDIIKIISGMLN